MTRNRPPASASNGSSSEGSRDRDFQGQPRPVDGSDESNDDLFDDLDEDWGEDVDEMVERTAETAERMVEQTTERVGGVLEEAIANVTEIDDFTDDFTEVSDTDTGSLADDDDASDFTDVEVIAEESAESIASAEVDTTEVEVTEVDVVDESMNVSTSDDANDFEGSTDISESDETTSDETTTDSFADEGAESFEASEAVEVSSVEVSESSVSSAEDSDKMTVDKTTFDSLADLEPETNPEPEESVAAAIAPKQGASAKNEVAPKKSSKPAKQSNKTTQPTQPEASATTAQSTSQSISQSTSQSTFAILKTLFATLGTVLVTLLKSIQQIWVALLPLIRKILPSGVARKLSDTGITIIALLFVGLVFWLNTLLPKQTEAIATYEPAPMVRDGGDRAVPTLPRAPRFKSLAPEQLAEIQTQFGQVADNYMEGLVRSVQDDLPRHLLTVQLSPDWYVLSEREQNRLTSAMVKLLPSLKFDHLELRDDEDLLVARNPVVGKTPLIYKRTRPLPPPAATPAEEEVVPSVPPAAT
jgi:hypothetical protein